MEIREVCSSDQARNAQYRVMTLDVADSNPRAEALYSDLGFCVVESKSFSGRSQTITGGKKMELVL